MWSLCSGSFIRSAWYCFPGHNDMGKYRLPDLMLLLYCFVLQGSVVVFSSWPNWTSTDMMSKDYCKDTPMMFAFVLLLVSWVCYYCPQYYISHHDHFNFKIMVIQCLSHFSCPGKKQIILNKL